MGGVEMPQAPRGWKMGRKYPPPYWGRVWVGGCPLPIKFFVFFVENTIF